MQLRLIVLLVGLAVSAGHLAPNSIRLSLVPDVNGGFLASVKLPGNAWEGASGEAQLTMDGKPLHQVQYKITGESFEADIPATLLPNISGATATLTYPAQNTEGTYAIDIHPSAAGEAADQDLVGLKSGGRESVTLQTPKGDSDIGQQEPSWRNDLLQGRSPAWMTQVLLLAVIALFGWRAWDLYRQRKRGSRTRKMERRIDALEQDLNSISLAPASNDGGAIKALARAETAQHLAENAMQASTQLKQQLNETSQRIETLDGLKSSLDSLRAELNTVGSSLRDWKREDRRPAPPPVRTEIPREAALIVAVVNRWIKQASKSRSQLVQLGKEVDVSVELAMHKDLSRVFHDLTTFEYPFEFEGNGPWVWTQIPGTADYWAAPADATSFTMGLAPSLLDRLFDGMIGVREGFRFEAIYRPCRLRPVPGKSGLYAAVERGLIQLEMAAAPTEPAPVPYDAFLRRAPSPDAFAGVSDETGVLLAEWIRSMNRQLQDKSVEIDALGEQLSRMESAHSQVVRESAGRLNEQVNQQLQVFHHRLRQVEESLERALATPSSEPAPKGGDAVSDPPAAPVAAPAATPQTSLSNPATPVPAPVLPLPDAAPATPVTVQIQALQAADQAPPEFSMPTGWQEAMTRAAERAGAAQEVNELPTTEMYVARARILSEELSRFTQRPPVGVVHVKKREQDQFDIHEVTGVDENISCTVCGTSPAWQLAVRVGAANAPQAFLLFPLGKLAKQNYAAGYSALIHGPLEGAFCIGLVTEPAVLRRNEDSSTTYTVTRKMTVAAPAPVGA